LRRILQPCVLLWIIQGNSIPDTRMMVLLHHGPNSFILTILLNSDKTLLIRNFLPPNHTFSLRIAGTWRLSR
jgi:hypothetical protein